MTNVYSFTPHGKDPHWAWSLSAVADRHDETNRPVHEILRGAQLLRYTPGSEYVKANDPDVEARFEYSVAGTTREEVRDFDTTINVAWPNDRPNYRNPVDAILRGVAERADHTDLSPLLVFQGHGVAIGREFGRS